MKMRNILLALVVGAALSSQAFASQTCAYQCSSTDSKDKQACCGTT